MKWVLNFGIVALAVCGSSLFAQSNPSSTEGKQAPAPNSETQAPTHAATGKAYGSIDVLSDTMGVNFGPYLQRVLPEIKRNWYSHIPASAKAPIFTKGTVVIEFAILKDGKVRGMRLVNASGDVSLDRGAWAAIATSNPLPPLPNEFAGQYLALRMKFLYNPNRDDKDQGASSDMPAGLEVSPAFLQLDGGAKQQFSASVVGNANSAVIWNLSCAATFCGRISANGLYTAPLEVPNPTTVTVIATLAADPGKTGSAIVRLQASPSHDTGGSSAK